ncbi:MAG: hypothetical protein IT364_22280, partial [Candidatus Hydrogenedentes bacterium]|nr:hypothetical protein [Candidatus Hydrogenedentota bacterium]
GGKTNDGTIETQLAVSRDGVSWTRYRTPYIALGNYDGLDIKVAMMIPGLLYQDNKIYQYFMGYAFTHGDTQVRYGDGGRDLGGVFRAEQRIDGFTSLDFDYEGGVVTTAPFTFAGQRLLLNLNASASGEAQVAILDAGGNELPGFALADSRIINGDYLAATATWKEGTWDVSSLQGQPVRLKFSCRGTKLYSFRFAAPGIDAPYTVERSANEPVPSLNLRTAPAAEPVEAENGPHLFIDDYLIAESENVTRTTHPPVRAQDRPILGWEQETTQPYVTVLRDPESGRFRMWYNSRIGRECAIAYAESEDGIHWTTPPVGPEGEDNRLFVISAPFQNAYGVSVIDEGPSFPDADHRFKLAWWGQSQPWPDGDPGMRIAFSPDGLRWTQFEANPVLPDYGEEWFKDDPRRPYGASDIIDVFRDPIRQRYAAFVKTPALPIDGLEPGSRARSFIRRLVSQSVSADFVHWEMPWRVVVPEPGDDGVLEFYGVGGTFARGGLLIGFVRMLHDDYPCEPGGSPDGIGYTTLVTSRDGRHWERHPDVFFDRNPQPGTWDRAMTWVGSLVEVGSEYYLYYGGYARGHKIEPAKERQLGLAIMPKDRFVSRDAQPGSTGHILTVPFTFAGAGGVQLYLNADARGGSIRVRVLEADKTPIPGMGYAECVPVTEDGLSLEVQGLNFGSFSSESPIRLEFELTGAQLYGFEFK